MSSEPLLSHRLAPQEREHGGDDRLSNGDRPSSKFQPSNLAFLFGPWVIGITLGLLLCNCEAAEGGKHSLPPSLDKISASIGWIYFAAWSISFYPQMWTNWHRKSVVGLSIDFQVLNLLGFTCYAVYNTAMYFSPSVRKQYQAIHAGQLPAVHINDVAFAIHAFLATTITLTQCFLYRNNRNGDNNNNGARTPSSPSPTATNTVSIYTKITVATAILLSFLWAGIILLSPTVDPPLNPCTQTKCPPLSLLNWLTWLYFLSSIKFLVTLVKYIPQVVLNCQRQSTEGWNVWNVLLDFEGGILSLAQQIIDAQVCGSLTPIIGSPIKAGLSFISMLFDVLFIAQHFILYPDWKRKVAERAMEADYERI